MPRKPSGQVIERRTATGVTYALRFRAYGERRYITLGTNDDGWSRQRAERELAHVLADVDRGIWKATVAPVGDVPVDPNFHEFASEWLAAREPELRPATIQDYTWQLTHHLLPFFHAHRLSQITVAEVDRYREHKVREGIIAAESINKTITRLGQFLAVAEERDLIARHPVRVNTRNRKLKAPRKPPIYLDRAEQIAVLLEAASQLDAGKQARTSGRRGFIATLAFAGLRIHEVSDLTWRDVDLPRGRITVGRAKTDAGIRIVDILPVLQDELTAHGTTTKYTGRGDYVFPTAVGTYRDKDNARKNVVNPVVKRAGELLAERDEDPLPKGVTAHKLRHTFTSILFALGKDPAHVMGQLGHTDAAFTLRVYAHAMRRDPGDLDRLKALVNGADWAPMGTGSPISPETPAPEADEDTEKPQGEPVETGPVGPGTAPFGPTNGPMVEPIECAGRNTLRGEWALAARGSAYAGASGSQPTASRSEPCARRPRRRRSPTPSSRRSSFAP